MKKLILIALLCSVTSFVTAQITTDEQPYGLLLNSRLNVLQTSYDQKKIHTVSSERKAEIAQEDAVNDTEHGPVRFAFPVEVKLHRSTII
jgi:hypothetical protein